MDIKKYTIKTQELIQKAQSLAVEKTHQAIETQHIAFAILTDEENLVLQTLKKLGVSTNVMIKKLEDSINTKIPKISGVEHGQFLGKTAQNSVNKSETPHEGVQRFIC